MILVSTILKPSLHANRQDVQNLYYTNDFHAISDIHE